MTRRSGKDRSRRSLPTVFVSDYDRTLAARHHRPSAKVVQALQELRRRGVAVIVATGRADDEALRLTRQLGPLDAVVSEDGAIVRIPRWNYRNVHGQSIGERVQIRLRKAKLRSYPGRVVHSVPRSELRRAERAVRGLPVALTVNRDRCMIVPRGIDKASGVREAARAFASSSVRMAVIGDGENDVPLLRRSPLSATVANAVPEARAAARYHCRYAYGRGVVEYIEHLFGPLRESARPR